MDESLIAIHQEIASSSSPAAEFEKAPRSRQREVFFQLPETVRQGLVEDMNREQLRQFVRRLDPDEVADVLGLADQPSERGALDLRLGEPLGLDEAGVQLAHRD
ncbi:MAG: magnesium transporter MgtE N-terminal domain-containing protein, partial [Halodesulfurarchaeum sp.]